MKNSFESEPRGHWSISRDGILSTRDIHNQGKLRDEITYVLHGMVVALVGVMVVFMKGSIVIN